MTTTNLLYEKVDYKIETTEFGEWKSHLNFAGQLYREFTSHRKVFGMPLVHYTNGRDPQTGRRKIARGFFAIGRIAVGVFPVGQLAIGMIPIGQAAFGLVFGLGQLSTGIIAIGQGAIGLLFGLGQFATGFISIGQFALGYYSIAQIALAVHKIDMMHSDPIIKSYLYKWFK